MGEDIDKTQVSTSVLHEKKRDDSDKCYSKIAIEVTFPQRFTTEMSGGLGFRCLSACTGVLVAPRGRHLNERHNRPCPFTVSSSWHVDIDSNIHYDTILECAFRNAPRS